MVNGGVSVKIQGKVKGAVRIQETSTVDLISGEYSSISIWRATNIVIKNAIVNGRIAVQTMGETIRIEGSRLGGDVLVENIASNVRLERNGLKNIAVTVRDALEGPVNLINNAIVGSQSVRPAIRILDSRAVRIFGNVLDSVLVANNKKTTDVSGNVIRKLSCTNNEQVVGQGNSNVSNEGCPAGLILQN